MALTKTDIANLALGRIGAKRIMDLDDESSAPARVCKNFMEATIREVGRSHTWGCLKKRESLGKLSADPPFGWKSQFQLPADFLRLVQLNGMEAWEVEDFYVIEGKRLLCDEEIAETVYVAYIEDSTQFDSLLSETIGILLASKIAVSIRQDEGLANTLRSEYERTALPNARRIDGGEKKRRQYDYAKESKWLRSRRYSTNG